MDARRYECSVEQGRLPPNCCIGRERVCAREHFIRDNGQCPYIGRRARALSGELFRRHIAGVPAMAPVAVAMLEVVEIPNALASPKSRTVTPIIVNPGGGTL
jgi:hypothetical protein